MPMTGKSDVGQCQGPRNGAVGRGFGATAVRWQCSLMGSGIGPLYRYSISFTPRETVRNGKLGSPFTSSVSFFFSPPSIPF